jgi:hypothetical protein
MTPLLEGVLSRVSARSEKPKPGGAGEPAVA